MAPRIFFVGDAVGHPVQPLNSVLAGCWGVVDVARGLLFALLEYQHRAYRPRLLAQQVDDVVLGDVGDDPRLLADKVTDMLLDYVEQSRARRLVFSPKSTIVATTLDLVRRVERGLRRHGVVEFTAKVSVRDVGLDFGGGRRRTVAVRNARLAKCSGRLRQIATLSRAYAPASKLSSSGAVPAALYGEEAMGLPAAFLQQLQNKMIMAAGMDPSGRLSRRDVRSRVRPQDGPLAHLPPSHPAVVLRRLPQG